MEIVGNEVIDDRNRPFLVIAGITALNMLRFDKNELEYEKSIELLKEIKKQYLEIIKK